MRSNKPSFIKYLINKTDMRRIGMMFLIALVWAAIAWALDSLRLLAAIAATYFIFCVLYACTSFCHWKRYVK
jgi:hypothetical protein